MNYLNAILVSCCSNSLFIVFAIAFAGFMIGNIKIKGVGLGAAGVFLAALVFGHFGYADQSLLHEIGLITIDNAALKLTMSMVQNMGPLCFVTSVGFIAGPNFFCNLKRNAKSYVCLAFVVIGIGSIICIAVISLTNIDSAMAVGILSGALTTTPGFAAAQANEVLLNEVTVGYAIGYPFGVVGVVLFVQLIPKILRVNLVEERAKLIVNSAKEKGKKKKKYTEIDSLGLCAFTLAIICGILLGKISIPLPGGATFSLGNTGGAVLMGLLFGHFGHAGSLSMKLSHGFLESFREFGLMMFLIGAGVPGGSGFVDIIHKYGMILFIYGALMTLLPLIIGFLFAKHVVNLCLLDNLGSLTGGMTSTPALGVLIRSSGTDDVASSYASTYPVALVLIVLASQFIVTFL